MSSRPLPPTLLRACMCTAAEPQLFRSAYSTDFGNRRGGCWAPHALLQEPKKCCGMCCIILCKMPPEARWRASAGSVLSSARLPVIVVGSPLNCASCSTGSPVAAEPTAGRAPELRAPCGVAGRDGQWDQAFADAVDFAADPVIVDPDVTELLLKAEDEFVIIASDGLWCAAVQGIVQPCHQGLALSPRSVSGSVPRSRAWGAGPPWFRVQGAGARRVLCGLREGSAAMSAWRWTGGPLKEL